MVSSVSRLRMSFKIWFVLASSVEHPFAVVQKSLSLIVFGLKIFGKLIHFFNLVNHVLKLFNVAFVPVVLVLHAIIQPYH